MSNFRLWPVYLGIVIGLVCLSQSAMGQNNVSRSDETQTSGMLKTLHQIGPMGKGHVQAMQAWEKLSKVSASELPYLMEGMTRENALANNWLRMAIDTVADQALANKQQLPLGRIEAVLANTKIAPRGREVAYEWLTKLDTTAENRWIPKMLNDPSLDLRWKSVDAKLKQAEAAVQNNDKDLAVTEYRIAIEAARNVDQIKSATKALRELGEEVDLQQLFGFLVDWKLIGPFDNVDKQGFDRDYPPEQNIDFEETYEGKEGVKVAWTSHSTSDEYGLVDLNEALGKSMGAASYAFTTFDAAEAGQVDIRLGSTNANKVWLNGQLLTANHVYHSGDGIDQYIVKGNLQAGENTILLKICQNEQTDSWAQDWSFQIRVCDDLGKAILSTDRKSAK